MTPVLSISEKGYKAAFQFTFSALYSAAARLFPKQREKFFYQGL
jgi:hypothetical protein